MFQRFSDTQIVTAVSVATAVGLRPITPPERRTAIANYTDYYASLLYTVTGNPTPAQLTTLLTNAIPANVREQYPELVSFVVPIIVSNYELLYAKYGANRAVQILNDIATGLEAGASVYITRS